MAIAIIVMANSNRYEVIVMAIAMGWIFRDPHLPYYCTTGLPKPQLAGGTTPRPKKSISSTDEFWQEQQLPTTGTQPIFPAHLKCDDQEWNFYFKLMLNNQIHAVIHVSAPESQPKGGFSVTTEPR